MKPENLLNLKNRLEVYYSTMHSRIHKGRDMAAKRFHNLPQLPEGVPIHESSTARNLIDNLADQIRTDNPRVSFRAAGPSQKAQKQKELLELWGQYLLELLPQRCLINPFEQAKRDLLRDGAGCIKFITDISALPDPPERADFSTKAKYLEALHIWQGERASTWAFDVRPVDVLQVYPEPTRSRSPKYYLEVQQRFALDVLADEALDFPFLDKKKPIAGKDSPLRTVEWLEYWDEENYIVEVDGQRVIEKTNPFGFVPYTWSYNGLGRLDVSGDPSMLGEGILEPVFGELEAEVRVKTAMDAQWQFHVFPRLITTDDPKKARAQFQKGPGAIIRVASMDQAPKWLETTPPNPQMVQFLNEIKSTISQRFPASLTQRPEGVDAAVHQALLVGQALKPLQPIKQALNRLATGLLNGLARQMVALNLSLNVYSSKVPSEPARMVKAADFTHFNFDVKFEATDPAEDDRKLLTGLALLRVPGILSRRSFREKFGKALALGNEEEEEQILVERSLDMMAEQGMLMQSIMAEMQAQQQQETMAGAAGVAREQAIAAMQAGTQQAVPGGRERSLASPAGLGGAPIPADAGRTPANMAMGAAGVTRNG